jgi:transcriptional regulator with XRE-family HTH domain
VQVTQVTISHLESGKTRSVNLDLLDRLARALKVRASELGVLLKRE